jgi:hypothetical protein
LRDLAVFLCDDGTHALIFTNWSTDDDPPMATLKLDGVITEEQFDWTGIAEYLREDAVMH